MNRDHNYRKNMPRMTFVAKRIKCALGRHEWRVNELQPLNLSIHQCSWSCAICQRHEVAGWPKLEPEQP